MLIMNEYNKRVKKYTQIHHIEGACTLSPRAAARSHTNWTRLWHSLKEGSNAWNCCLAQSPLFVNKPRGSPILKDNDEENSSTASVLVSD